MSVSSYTNYEIQQGTATPSEESLVLLGTMQTGDPGAKRVLTHPVSASWPPISYQRNPDRTANLDNEILSPPTTRVVKTAGTTAVIVWADNDDDVLITERWDGGRRKPSVETWFWRKLYEYFKNTPPLDPDAQEYIQWEPRDRNANTYNVVLTKLLVGDSSGRLWITDLVPNQGTIGGGMQNSDVPGSGVLLEFMELEFKVVSEV